MAIQTNDVAITGIGMIGPLGSTAPEYKKAWLSGASAETMLLDELKGTPLENTKVAQMPSFDPAARLGGRRMLKYMSEAAVLGCVAAHEAVHDSDLVKRFTPERVGLYAAPGLAAANVRDVTTMVEQSIDGEGHFSSALLGSRGLAVTNPLISFKILPNMPPSLISIIEGIKGPNLIFTPWEGHTGAALMEAWRAVRAGTVDCALTGAADTASSPATVLYLRQAGYLGEQEYPSSGAAYIVLESVHTAKRDNKRIYGRIFDIDVTSAGSLPQDPLAERMGRSFAAAPAILMGLAGMCGWEGFSICGADGQELKVVLGES